LTLAILKAHRYGDAVVPDWNTSLTCDHLLADRSSPDFSSFHRTVVEHRHDSDMHAIDQKE
jgi:hypothetical protein